MKSSLRGLFRREGVFVTVNVKSNDGYLSIAKKAADVLGLVGPESNLRLFRSRGALIPISEEWTLHQHKRVAHIGADCVQLGVAFFQAPNTLPCVASTLNLAAGMTDVKI